MKFTRNKAAPVVTPPDTFTLELSLDEMIFLKSMCSYYAEAALGRTRAAAERFIKRIPEVPWSWGNTATLFK